MVQMQFGQYSLTYDPVFDTGNLLLGDLLIATYDPGWHMLNGPGCFEFETAQGGAVKRKAQSRLRHLRSLTRITMDFFDDLHRKLALDELRRWDRTMKHGIWKCKRDACIVCSPSEQQSFMAATHCDSCRNWFT